MLNTNLTPVNWSGFEEIGSTLNIPSASGTICVISPTAIVFADNVNDTIEAYRFNGRNWISISSALSIPGMTASSIASLTAGDICLVEQTQIQ